MEIIVSGVFDYIPNVDLYEFIDMQYKHSRNFVVCHVEPDEFARMKDMLRENGVLNEKIPKNIETGYVTNRYMLAYNMHKNSIEIADYNNPEKKGRYYIGQGEIYYDEYGYSFLSVKGTKHVTLSGMKIYTTEDYEDIMHYYPHVYLYNNSDDESRYRLLSNRKKEIENLKIYKEYVKLCKEMDMLEQKRLIKEQINNPIEKK